MMMESVNGFNLTGYAAAFALAYVSRSESTNRSIYKILTIYRILLHPLSKYPGPVVAKLSDSYGGFYSLKRTLHLKTWQDHQEYGSVIRHGPNKLVFISVKALHDIYLNDDVSKSLCYQAGNVNPNTTNVFNTIDKRVHRVKRKLVGQIVTERSIGVFEPKLSQQVDIFLRQILSSHKKDRAASINMSERCKYLSLDIAAYLGFGYALNLQIDPAYRYLTQAMMIGSWRLNMYMQFPFIRKLRLEILFYVLAIIQGKSFLKTLSMMIQSRLAKDKNAEHDLYAFMADALDAPQEDRITASEIWTEGIFFLPAAGDTTSTTLSALFFYLARNPQCREKLMHEIRSTYTSADEIGGSRLAGCRYLRACINESLRMSPPVPGTLWREKLPADGSPVLVVDGHAIPPGTQVGVNIYALHHNPEYFPEPFTYSPERWLSSNSANNTGLADKGNIQAGAPGLVNHPAFIPFSLGARGCAGKALAYTEVAMTMAKTLWYFDFELTNDSSKGSDSAHTEFRLWDIFTSTHDGPFLNFKPRAGGFCEGLMAVP
ncbi:benzoate 4-monooxygenase cytochrome P450 [Astrocystis sublimbata]|nr:benzoate 4-monooxygenase cytochrome P450 [Astrocystis sublimbata]